MEKKLHLENIKINNLDIEYLDLPLDKFHVFCGPSGSGKSSLAFDVIYNTANQNGKAFGASRIYRKNKSNFKINGLPEQVIGIEQQINNRKIIQSIGFYIGILPIEGIKICTRCYGEGYIRDIDSLKVIRDENKSVTNGALTSSVKKVVSLNLNKWKKFSESYNISITEHWKNIPTDLKKMILEGHNKYFLPILPTLRSFTKNIESAPYGLSEELSYYITYHVCPCCGGFGTIYNHLDINCTLLKFPKFSLFEKKLLHLLSIEDLIITDPIFNLSSSTARKLRFFSILRKAQKNSLIIFDEPCAGLTPTEARTFSQVLHSIHKEGYTLIVIDHLREVIESADWITEFGPKSGFLGGKVLYSGPIFNWKKKNFFNTNIDINRIELLDLNKGHQLDFYFNKWNNFLDVKINIPLNKLVCISGPSASGKTSILESIFAVCDKSPISWQGRTNLVYKKGTENIRRPYQITPDPIGLHPNSTPATYVGLWDKIRELYASLPLSKELKLLKTHFSFNMKVGQCPVCFGVGYLKGKNQIFELCPKCNGRRFSEKVLQPLYKKLSISDINNLTIEQAYTFFEDSKIIHYLDYFIQVGLDYLILGQHSNSLSGGENLRVKLAYILSKHLGERSVYILDNPCRGSGSFYSALLLNSLRKLAKKHSVIIAENDPLAINYADWVIILDYPEVISNGEKRIKIHYEGKNMNLQNNE